MSEKSPHLDIATFLDNKFSGKVAQHPFYYFEPWSVEKRPQSVLDQMKRDGVDLYSPEMLRFVPTDPHPFQDGYLLSTEKMRTIIAANRVGKAQPHDAKIYGENGEYLMGDIVKGDKVFGQDGKLYTVLQIYEQGERDVYKLTFEDESSTECDIDHLWEVYKCNTMSKVLNWHGKRVKNPQWMQTTVLPLKELIERYGIMPHPTRKWSVKLTKKISWRKKKHIIPPYSLGVLLGDGSFVYYGTSFTCNINSNDLVNRVRDEIGIYRYNKKQNTTAMSYFVSLYRGKIRCELDRLGLGGKRSECKFVPKEYLYDSAENRLELLRGLMDTDGSIFGHCVCEFYSKSKRLAEDVAWIAKSLGGRARIRTKSSHYTKNNKRIDCGIGYRVKIVLFNDNPFFTNRKASKWHKIKWLDRRRIKNISYSGKKQCRCIVVDNPKQLYLTDDFIVTHNSISAMIELGIMVSGEKPLALRFIKGAKTNIKRLITPDNVMRWGRFDVKTEKFLDKNIHVMADGSWDCGYIVGAGIYPDEKIMPPGGIIWIGTTSQALHEIWWPRLTEDNDKNLFPFEFIDRKRGLDGLMKSEWTVYGIRGTRITIITYESGYRKYESEEVHACWFDEEAPDQRCVTAAINHCRNYNNREEQGFFSLVLTPYMGMTYTRKLIFDPHRKDSAIFHATAYDSPYLSEGIIKHRRAIMPSHEIGARIWGLHTAVKGKPYFDRTKIMAWIRNYKTPYELYKFRPFDEFDGMFSREDRDKPGLMDVEITATKTEGKENQQDIWRVYEKPREGMAYFLMADSAEGSDIPIESGDVLASLVMRPPIGEEKFPQIVASLRSTVKTVNFAWLCAYALRYYNNALLCAEGPTRGSFNALFFAELSDYPYWYNQPSERWSTRKFRTVKGFDTNVATRTAIFDNISEVLGAFDADEKPEINDEPLLIELASCVVTATSGRLRPDHTSDSTLDTAICYGQSLFVWKHSPEQIKCRAFKKEKESTFGKLLKKIAEPKKPVYLGESDEILR